MWKLKARTTSWGTASSRTTPRSLIKLPRRSSPATARRGSGGRPPALSRETARSRSPRPRFFPPPTPPPPRFQFPAPATSEPSEAPPSPLLQPIIYQNGTAVHSQTRSSTTAERMSASAPARLPQNLKSRTHRQEPPPTSSTSPTSPPRPPPPPASLSERRTQSTTPAPRLRQSLESSNRTS